MWGGSTDPAPAKASPGQKRVSAQASPPTPTPTPCARARPGRRLRLQGEEPEGGGGGGMKERGAESPPQTHTRTLLPSARPPTTTTTTPAQPLRAEARWQPGSAFYLDADQIGTFRHVSTERRPATQTQEVGRAPHRTPWLFFSLSLSFPHPPSSSRAAGLRLSARCFGCLAWLAGWLAWLGFLSPQQRLGRPGEGALTARRLLLLLLRSPVSRPRAPQPARRGPSHGSEKGGEARRCRLFFSRSRAPGCLLLFLHLHLLLRQPPSLGPGPPRNDARQERELEAERAALVAVALAAAPPAHGPGEFLG